jgi:diguanylate cyclase (GGDEF)-like protein
MLKLLIIEDSLMMQKIIRHVAATDLDCAFDIADNYAQAKELISHTEYYLALADLHLPDATHGEIVDLMLDAGIATIVLTGSLDEEKRRLMLKKGVLDYIFKENRDSYFHAVKLANQILRNRDISVLLADDSNTLRTHIRKQLEKMLFKVIEVDNGVEALAALADNNNIELLITDFNMPKMDGIELIRIVRKSKPRDSFPIIGLSSSNDPTLSAQFIKHGANDFLVTPFIHEEFQWRILKTMEQISLIRTITEAANQDYLTKLYNRRYFFTQANKLYNQASLAKTSIVIALIDIDFFKKINDNYGHDSGDAVLIKLSAILKQHFRQHTVARYGGEEFILLLDNIGIKKSLQLLEKLRTDIAETDFEIPDGKISVTISTGASALKNESLEALINLADIALYKAKESGRNKVVISA